MLYGLQLYNEAMLGVVMCAYRYDVLVSCSPASGSSQCATDDIVKDSLYPLLNKVGLGVGVVGVGVDIVKGSLNKG